MPINPAPTIADTLNKWPLAQAVSFLPGINSDSPNTEALNLIRSQFELTSVTAIDGLITGYYLPRIRGALTKTTQASYPIYALPDTEAQRRLTRQEIDGNGALAQEGIAIAWVNDPIDLFFVHIQGYGILELGDGEERIIQKAGDNGHGYYPIGRALIEQGAITKEALSMQSIKAYLRANPNQIEQILHRNPRYIFFTLQDRGPIGSSGDALIPFRSLACDWTYYPPGSLLYIETTLPRFNEKEDAIGSTPLSFIAVCHDSGSAIVGPGRIDLYCGDNQLIAGHLKAAGKIYLLKRK